MWKKLLAFIDSGINENGPTTQRLVEKVKFSMNNAIFFVWCEKFNASDFYKRRICNIIMQEIVFLSYRKRCSKQVIDPTIMNNFAHLQKKILMIIIGFVVLLWIPFFFFFVISK